MQYDQTIKSDKGKTRISIVPLQIINDIAEVREFGISKYGNSNSWKSVEIERYQNALFRHFAAFLDNPFSKDAESGIEHYKHLACNAAFICQLMEEMKNKIIEQKEVKDNGKKEGNEKRRLPIKLEGVVVGYREISESEV